MTTKKKDPVKEIKKEVTEKEVKKESKTEFIIEKEGKYIRTYSVEVHGKDAEKLAKSFAKKFEAKIK